MMRTVFYVLFVLLAACQPKNNNDAEKSLKNSGDESKTGNTGWTDEDREKFIDICVETMTKNDAPENGARKACACSLEKIESEYKDFETADRGDVELIKELMLACVEEVRELMDY